MGDIVNNNESLDLVEITEGLLFDARASLRPEETTCIPIAELATLGVGVSSLIPALRTITQTTTVSTDGLYRLANQQVGDVLKTAKNGNFWGAFKTADNKSKFLQLKEAGTQTVTTSTAMPIDPATLMMAAALASIERQLNDISEMCKQIISFLEIEKESEIEADVETLLNIILKYKSNWNNEQFVNSNHKMVLDIQRTARKNIIAYQKKVNEVYGARRMVVNQAKVNAVLDDFAKQFKYYRLSLYAFSLASLIEIMLSGNFKEGYISGIKNEVHVLAETYRDTFGKCSIYLEKLSHSALDVNLLKGLGHTGEAAGKMLEKVPFVKKGNLDELLQSTGEKLKGDAEGRMNKSVGDFATLGNPCIGVFEEKMNDMINIYNHTSQIGFDKDNIYLIAN
ncbi:hypothetical protein [Ohessyouella blattaphilus]|uniref:Uncharacterized protein n=1 Tax=Ohessyouella blattaphilus TaxID=2949333 RepID=A0ABT1EJ94_9FIRM|nr:hypothetical protein [Ohessyouella blattaphilus]MCP1110539.1 hypothetical protein [Ohessyouella blattaphilus]MCR8563933.1 hypothetical protein [Ohessyouella blattaphilus]MDL2249463.1 hypothetical protein [Lachnospiraceae bacterium OttesenSCG-928-J05]